MTGTAPTNLADHLRRLLEAVKQACGMRGRGGLLAGPMALVMWICTRRMRKEIEAAAKQSAAMVEQLLALLEDFRAGKLTAPNASEVEYPPPRPSGERPEPEARAGSARPRQTPVVRTQTHVEETPHPPTSPGPGPEACLPHSGEGKEAWRLDFAKPVRPHRDHIDRFRPHSAGHAGRLFLNGDSATWENCAHFVTM